jgi:putative copper export protein
MFNGAFPAGSLELSHVPLVLARAVWLCALFSATGALWFGALEPSGAALRRLIGGSLAVACGAWVVWVILQAAEIAGATDIAGAFAALPPVFARAAFGHGAALQIGLVLLASAAWRLGGRWSPAVLALASVTVQVGHLHAWAMTGGVSVLTVAVLLHLWAAALWLGALVPLALVVRAAPLPAAIATVRRFSRRASVLVAVLALTALVQGAEMLGGVPGLFGALYGWVAMGKALLFAVLLALAYRHRFRLTPALSGADPAAARTALARSIAVETGVGVCVILAASVLTALPPGMHVEPLWPFTRRLAEPFTAADAATLGALIAAVVLLAGAVAMPRWRRRAGGVALVLALLAAPRMGALTQPATPTSFYHSETGFTAASVADGGVQFAAHCAGCHAAVGALPAGDGDLFWTLTNGAPGMPGFAARLDDDARWHLIDFLRARAAAGSLPTRAPDVTLACADGSAPALSDLRGKQVRLVFATTTAPESCRIDDPDAAAAYAAATGLSRDELAGVALLIGADGRIERVRRPDASVAAPRG